MNTSEAANLLEGEPFSLGIVPWDICAAWVALTAALCAYWYVRYRQAGVLTFDVFFIGLYLYVPIVFMSLFAYSPLNSVVATSDWHWRYEPKIRTAYYISLLGTASFLIAAWWGARSSTPPPGYRLVYQSLHNFWCTPLGVGSLSVLLAVLCLGVIVSMGVPFSVRDAAAEHAEFRPIMHIFNSAAIVGIFVFLISGYMHRSRVYTALGVALIVVMLAFGSRKVTVGSLLYYAAIRLIARRSRRAGRAAAVSLAGLCLLIALGVGVEGLREFDFSLARIVNAPARVLFGNNLSELRDFSWILAGWDGELLWGQTYAAGVLSWIPSSLLPDRTDWSWGTFSTRFTGLTGGTHPGLRPTVFAEAYFNFDLAGVVAFGLFLGAIFGRVTAFAQRAMNDPDPRQRAFAMLVCFLYFEFFLRFQQSPNYFQSYVELALVLIGLTGAQIVYHFRRESEEHRAAAGPALSPSS